MKPAVLNLELFKGDDYDLTLLFVDEIDAPIDLSSRTFVAPVRRFADSRDATLFTIDASDAVGGVLRLSLAAGATDSLVTGDWLLQETVSGKRHTILGGRLTVVQEARGVAEGVTATVRLAPDVVRVVTTGTTGPTGPAAPSGTYELHPAGGTDGQVLTKDSTTPTGNRWAAGGGGGGSDANFVFQQATPSASWTVTHNLAKRPCVDVVDASGNVVLADIQYLSDNALVVSFSAAVTGAAYVN